MRDERGAMMLLGAFMATFLVGVLYYVSGTAEAIFYRQGMQDAADAAALTSAVAHARGMNFLALINLLMAALMMILLALKALETLIMILMVVLTALSATGVLSAGAVSAIAALERVREAVSQLHVQARQVIFPTLKAMGQVSNAIRIVTPTAAEALTVHHVMTRGKPATFGFVLPHQMTLPVERDEFSVLCARAGENFIDLALFPFQEGVFNVVRTTLRDAAGSLAGSLPGYLCGKPDAKAPEVSVKIERGYPLTQLGQACIDNPNDKAACDKATEERKQAAPDEAGNCRQHCGKGELFDRFTTLARIQCEPKPANTIVAWQWQQAWVREQLKWSEAHGAYVTIRRDLTRASVREGERVPCGPALTALSEDWNIQRHSPLEADLSQAQPVCGRSIQEPPSDHPKDAVFLRQYEAVTEIFGCTRRVSAKFEVEPEELPEDKEAPWKVEEGLTLGGNTFQQRAIVLGESNELGAEAGVRIASRKDCGGAKAAASEACDEGAVTGTMRVLGRVALAQAEYYYDGEPGEPEEWLWNMNWRARLRRFRLPEREEQPKGPSAEEAAKYGGKAPAESAEEACSREAPARASKASAESRGNSAQSQAARCGDVQSVLDKLVSVIKH